MVDWIFEIVYKKEEQIIHNHKNHATARNEINYKTYKTKLNRILKTAESEWYSKQLQINKCNMKKTWEIIKEKMNKRKNNSNARWMQITKWRNNVR